MAIDAFDPDRGQATISAMGTHPVHDPYRHLTNIAANAMSGRGVDILSTISSVMPSPCEREVEQTDCLYEKHVRYHGGRSMWKVRERIKG